MGVPHVPSLAHQSIISSVRPYVLAVSAAIASFVSSSRRFIGRVVTLFSIARDFLFSISVLGHILLNLFSLVYYYVFLLLLPTHYLHRVETLVVLVAAATSDLDHPWEDVGAAVDDVREFWLAFHKYLAKEWELMAGACGVICA